eukprot:COSAG02_NODE_20859_length_813_cov_0.861345_1_plen_46_part_01
MVVAAGRNALRTSSRFSSGASRTAGLGVVTTTGGGGGGTGTPWVVW